MFHCCHTRPQTVNYLYKAVYSDFYIRQIFATSGCVPHSGNGCTSIVQLSVSHHLSLHVIQVNAMTDISLLANWDLFLRSHDSSNLDKQTSDLHVAISIIRYFECARACLYCRYRGVPQVFLWSVVFLQDIVSWTQDTQTVYKRNIEARSRNHCGRRKATKGKAIPLQFLDRPWGFQEVEAPRFQDNRHIKVIKSALRTGRLYCPGNIPGTHFC